MLSKIIALLCCLSISNIGWACSQPVTHLKKGDTVPCEGYLFSPEKEQEVRVNAVKVKSLENLTETQKNLIDLHKEQEKVLQEVADKERQRAEMWKGTAKDLVEIKPMTDTQKVLYFVGGILTTVAAGYAIGQASK